MAPFPASRSAHSSRRRSVGAVMACVAVLLLRRALPEPGPTFIKAGLRVPPKQRRPAGLSAQGSSASILDRVDASYNPAWVNAEENSITSLSWAHPQSAWAIAATAIYALDMSRFASLAPPSALEAVAATIVYMGLYCSRLDEVGKMDKHYQISFYASAGWTFYAATSLLHALSYGPDPVLATGPAEALHGWGGVVYLLSCLYFYSYHWGRQARHVMEGRFRPMFALGLGSLTFVHALTVGHIWRMFDDPKWYTTILQIYPQQWHWIADTRLAELYLTAAALFLVILHLRGVLTGTRNAVWVFLGTVIVPTAALFYETAALDAGWMAVGMDGPKHW
eukprot:TRINITY_DN7475_c0_g1_i2.p1 TRINITY_DN7475_c0_g1~~TRINITY_DN7475_c0_g1_i2.p1  ORF type:complete len:336 (-),score=48.44 TRINITY_DN7475_c0_g1_i2:149-1156(-)